jgi:hypothetical protein
VDTLNCWKSIWLKGCDKYTERVVSNELSQHGNIELGKDSAEIHGVERKLYNSRSEDVLCTMFCAVVSVDGDEEGELKGADK